MNEEQLDNAAAEHCKAMSEITAVNSYHAFKAGARWYESLPLAERLSEDEKNKIIVTHSIIKDWEKEDEGNKMQSIRKTLEKIFGKTLFNPTEQ